jgi:LysR family transcriptional regulator, glycine cleavage system transcriptional activator
MRRNLPTVTALHAFEVVYRLQSISAAAHELALTQGAVSKKILALEDYFGLQLFERQASGLRRTTAADRLWTRLPQCLDELEQVMADVKSLPACSGVLNLAVCPTFASKWLVPRLPQLYDAHPGISLNLRVQLANVDFLGSGIDAGIAFGHPSWLGCDHYLIAKEDLLPVCSPDYLQACGPIENAGDLHAHTLIHQLNRPHHWQRWLALHGCWSQPDQKGMSFELFAIVMEAAKAGMGIGLLPAIFVQEEIDNGKLVALFDPVCLSNDGYYLICPKGQATLGALAAFRNWLVHDSGEPGSAPLACAGPAPGAADAGLISTRSLIDRHDMDSEPAQ